MASVLMNRENWDSDTQGMRMPCEDEGIDVGDAATSQGTPKVISKSPEAGRQARNRFSCKALRRNQPCRHLGLGFWPPEL